MMNEQFPADRIKQNSAVGPAQLEVWLITQVQSQRFFVA